MPIPPTWEGQYPYTDLDWICFKIANFFKKVRIRICVYQFIGCGGYCNNRAKNTQVETKKRGKNLLDCYLIHQTNVLIFELKGNGYCALCTPWAFLRQYPLSRFFTGQSLFEWAMASPRCCLGGLGLGIVAAPVRYEI